MPEAEREPPAIDWAAARSRLARLERIAETDWRRPAEDVHRILAERARRYAAPQSSLEMEEAAGRPHFLFEAGGTRFAVEPLAVVSVSPLDAMTPLPCVPAHVRGAFYHKGQVVAVLDLPHLIGLAPAPQEGWIVTVTDGGAQVGLIAGGTLGTQRIAIPAEPGRPSFGQPQWARRARDGIFLIDVAALLRASDTRVKGNVSSRT